MSRPGLSVVIPTYEERENLEVLLDRLLPVLEEEGVDAEVVVVDDDSPDGTYEAAEAAGRRTGRVRAVRRTSERGIASALLEGCRLARGRHVAFMDADLAHAPEDLVRLYRACLEGGHDMVIGSRYLPGSRGMVGKSMVARLASVVAQGLTRALLGLEGTDVTHSFRVFRREVMQAVRDDLDPAGLVFLAELTYRTRQRGFDVAEVPVAYGRRGHGRTKLSLWREGRRYLARLVRLWWDRVARRR